MSESTADRKRLWRLPGRAKRLALELLQQLRAPKVWKWPRRTPVLIYDAAGSEFLRGDVVPPDAEVLHVRGELVNVPILLASLAAFARRNRWAYVDTFIRAVQPRLVVTFIDNDVAFYGLAARHPGLTTLFIQNGTRTKYGDVFEQLAGAGAERSGFAVHYMLTFGCCVGREYAKSLRGAVVPVGSLKNNSAARRRTTVPGSMVFVSQFRQSDGIALNGRWLPREEFFEQPDRLVIGFLIRYARERGKTFAIVGCNHDGNTVERERERRYYRRLVGQECALVHGDGPLASYDALDAAEVVVSIDSTMGYESAARGNKTAFFAVRLAASGMEGREFGWPGRYPDDGPFWTNRQDPAAFERILDHLFSIGDEEWQEHLRGVGFTDVMRFDPDNTTVRALLQRESGTAAQFEKEFATC